MPPNFRVVDESACANGWNSRLRVSSSMPMPVSSTVSVTRVRPPPSGAVEPRTVMPPRSVNFSALPSRLNRICRTRVGSPISVSSDPGSTAPLSIRPLPAACAWNVLITPSIRPESENTVLSSSSRPASILEKSSTSSMMRSSACALSRMVATVRRCAASSPWRSSTSIMPSTPFIGVRISWLMVARKVDFAWFAASASARSRSASRQRHLGRGARLGLRQLALLQLGDVAIDAEQAAVGERLVGELDVAPALASAARSGSRRACASCRRAP